MSFLDQKIDQNNVRSDAQTDKFKNSNWRKENDNLSCYALSKYSNEPEDDFENVSGLVYYTGYLYIVHCFRHIFGKV